MRLHTLIILALASVAGIAQAQYTFTQLDTDYGDPNVSRVFQGAPSLNNSGQISYVAAIVGGRNPSALYRYSQGGITTVASEANGFSHISEMTSINASGQIGFVAEDSNSNPTIYRYSGSSLDLIAGPDDNFDSIDPAPSINASGRVAFHGDRAMPGDVFTDGIYAGTGTGQNRFSPLYEDTGRFSSFGAPSMNDSGQVAFGATPADDFTALDLVLGDGANTTIIADNSQQFNGGFAFFGSSDLNNPGDVAFQAFRFDGTNGLFLYHGGAISTIADSSDGIHQTFNSFAINNTGGLAFVGGLADGTSGLFVGDDTTHPLLSAGDTLFGKTVIFYSLSREGLNDSGQLAFYALYEDGTSSLVLANPVPEPATMAVLGLGLATLLRRRRKVK